MRSISKLLVLALLVVAACSGGSSSQPPAGAQPDGATDCTPDCEARTCGPDPVCGLSCGTCNEGECTATGVCQVSDPDGPRIVSLSAQRTQLLPGQSLEISAIVTDPDGVEDLIGGELRDATGATYGVFATAAQQGAYSLSVPWATLNDIETIQGEVPIERVFEAYFFDQAAHSAMQALPIRFACDAETDSLCGGQCFDLMTSQEHCGECNLSLSGGTAVCLDGMPICEYNAELLCDGACALPSEPHCGQCDNNCSDTAASLGASVGECLRPFGGPAEEAYCRFEISDPNPVACAAVCAGTTCVEERAVYLTSGVFSYYSLSCSSVPILNDPAFPDREFVRTDCVCRDP